MTDAVASMPFLSPKALLSSKSCVSLPIFFTPSSPKSSPKARLIWLAASTKSRMSCLPVIPKRPASAAKSLSFSRGVRVSIFLKASLSSSTSSAASPVYFDTPLMCSFMSAYISTKLLTHCLALSKISMLPAMDATVPTHLLPKPEILSPKLLSSSTSCCFRISCNSFLALLSASV